MSKSRENMLCVFEFESLNIMISFKCILVMGLQLSGRNETFGIKASFFCIISLKLDLDRLMKLCVVPQIQCYILLPLYIFRLMKLCVVPQIYCNILLLLYIFLINEIVCRATNSMLHFIAPVYFLD